MNTVVTCRRGAHAADAIIVGPSPRHVVSWEPKHGQEGATDTYRRQCVGAAHRPRTHSTLRKGHRPSSRPCVSGEHRGSGETDVFVRCNGG